MVKNDPSPSCYLLNLVSNNFKLLNLEGMEGTAPPPPTSYRLWWVAVTVAESAAIVLAVALEVAAAAAFPFLFVC